MIFSTQKLPKIVPSVFINNKSGAMNVASKISFYLYAFVRKYVGSDTMSNRDVLFL